MHLLPKYILLIFFCPTIKAAHSDHLYPNCFHYPELTWNQVQNSNIYLYIDLRNAGYYILDEHRWYLLAGGHFIMTQTELYFLHKEE